MGNTEAFVGLMLFWFCTFWVLGMYGESIIVGTANDISTEEGIFKIVPILETIFSFRPTDVPLFVNFLLKFMAVLTVWIGVNLIPFVGSE